tara:strand:+ start:823 stop:1230 length:408 start_codon:yes stop_codon:yes gene_type:complete
MDENTYHIHNYEYQTGNDIHITHEKLSPYPVLSMIAIILGVSVLNSICDCFRNDTNEELIEGLNETIIKKMTDEIQLFNNVLHNQQNECVICLDKYKNNDKIVQLSCNHIYHSDCIKGWFNQHTSCPLCRDEFII